MESSKKVACLYGSAGSLRKKTTGEQFISAFSIHKDIMNHNLKSSPGEEFFNFMGTQWPKYFYFENFRKFLQKKSG